MRRIETAADIAEGLADLVRRDPRLAAVVATAGEVPLRRSAPGFASLVSIIVAQQISRASADATLARLVALVDPLTPERMLSAGEGVFRAVGLSRPKQRTLLALAEVAAGPDLLLERLVELDADEAIARLTAVHGVGPWTAEVYLLTAAGHPDVFPAHDVALQTAAGHALGIDPRPGGKALYQIAESWAPWRAVAARLFWAYYARIRGWEAAPAL